MFLERSGGGELVFEPSFAVLVSVRVKVELVAAVELVSCGGGVAAAFSARLIQSLNRCCAWAVKAGIFDTRLFVSLTICGMTLPRRPPTRQKTTAKTMRIPHV